MSVRKNSIYNLIGSLAPLFVTLITLPIYIGLIGEERFGVLAIAWVLLGGFGLFDLGLGRATAQRIAKQKEATARERSNSFWTAVIINLSFGLMGSLILWTVAHVFFNEYFQSDGFLKLEIMQALPWLVFTLPITTLRAVLVGALQGREHFIALNTINFIDNILYQILPLFFVWFFSPTLTIILPVVLISRVLTLSLYFYYCKRHIPLTIKPSFDKAIAKSLFKFGGWITVSSIIGPIMVVFDKIIIGATLGAKMVTYYTLPFTLAERISIIPASLSSALFPRLAYESSSNQNSLTEESIKVLTTVLTPIMVIGIFFINSFISLWISADFSFNTSKVGSVFLIGVWATSIAAVPLSKLQASGRPDIVAKIHMVEILPYVIAMYFSILNWGILGASITWSLRAIIDFVLLFIFSNTSKNVITLFNIPVVLLFTSLFAVFYMPIDIYFHVFAVFITMTSLFWSYLNLPPSVLALIKRT